MGFFSFVKRIGRKIWDGAKTVGRTVNKGWKMGRKILNFAEKIPVIGDAVKTAENAIPGFNRIKDIGDRVSQTIDSLDGGGG